MTDKTFDPYAPESFAPDEYDNTDFGEVILHGGIQGMWLPKSDGSGKNELIEYDSANDTHKAAIASGKKVSIYYQVQFFAINSSFDSFMQNYVKFGDEWQELCKSLAEAWGIDKVKSDEFADKLRAWSSESIFAKWETEVIEYKDKNNIDRKKYIKRIQELYPSLKEATKAHDDHNGIDGSSAEIPTGLPEVQVMEKSQALTFIETQANNSLVDGAVDADALQSWIDSMPMLGEWKVTDEEIKNIIAKVTSAF